MEREEIFRYINVGRSKSICIDRRLLEQYPGIVRDVIIKSDTKLQIDYHDKFSLEMGEGEFSLYFYYEDYDKLFEAIEEFLSLKILQWENYTKTGWYPNLDEFDLEASWTKMKVDYVQKTLYLPSGFREFIIPSLYWTGLANGKLKINHTEEELHKYVLSTVDESDDSELE